MNRPLALALALAAGLAALAAPSARAQQADAVSPEEAALLDDARAVLARAGITQITPPLLPPRTSPTVLNDEDPEAALQARAHAVYERLGLPVPAPGPVPRPARPGPADDADPEAWLQARAEAAVERRLAALRDAPPPGDALALAGDVRVRGNTTTLRLRGGVIGELRTWQGLDVCGTCQISATTGTLVFTGGQDPQRFRNGAALAIGRMRMSKSSGRLVLDSVGVGGAGTFSFGDLNLAGGTLATPTSLTVTTALTGTGGPLMFTGGATQTLALPAGATSIYSLALEKSGGSLTVTPAVSVGSELLNAGTARLTGVTGVTGTLTLASGTLTLGGDLPVSGVLAASGGTFAPNGHTLSLEPTLDGGGQITRLAAVAGDGSTLTAPSPFGRPHVDGAGWRMIASPFAAVAFSALNDDFHTQGATGADTPLGAPNLLRWASSNAPGSRYVGVTDFTQPFASGQGYFLYAYGTDPGTGAPILPTEWDVEGVEPAGDVVALISFDVADLERRWNLLGNPFAAPIDWHDVQATGSFQAAHAVWDPAANGGLGNYAFYSSAGVATGRAGRYIPAFQGFWAEASLTSPFGLVFNRLWKEPYQSPVYVGRPGDATTAHLRLRLAGEGLEATEPVALFLDGAATGPDAYDGAWLRPLSQDYAAAFFVRGGERLVFDARPAAEGEPLRLGVETTRGGTYTLAWPDLAAAPEGPMTLTDLVTGAAVDMRAAGSYTFTAAANAAPVAPGGLPALAGGAATARFEVAFGVTTAGAGAPEVPAALALTAAPNPLADRALVRFGLPAAGAVRVAVYDVLGRHVATLADGERPAGWHEARLDASALAGGVYVVRLEAGGEARTVRLTVAR